MKDISWATTIASVFGMFVVVLLAFGVPDGGGGVSGNGLILARYAGIVSSPIAFGALAIAVLWLINRVRHKAYLTPKRDLVVVAAIALYLAIRGSQRLSQSGNAVALLCCLLFVVFLLARYRFSVPSLEATVAWVVGATIVALPIVAVVFSLWLLQYTLIGAAALFVVGAGSLLFLFLRKPKHGASSERT